MTLSPSIPTSSLPAGPSGHTTRMDFEGIYDDFFSPPFTFFWVLISHLEASKVGAWLSTILKVKALQGFAPLMTQVPLAAEQGLEADA